MKIGAEIINVTEYEEGFAILQDNAGKFLYTKDNPNPIPLPDWEEQDLITKAWFGNKNPCALLQSRSAMLT